MNTTLTYQCNNCGAGLKFDPEKQLFCCEFCLSEFLESELDAEEAETNRAENEEYRSHINQYVCRSCGAEIVADESTAADFCYYCHSPVVLEGKLEGDLKPHKIIPFKYGKDEAERRFSKYARKKWFAPKAFKSFEHAEKISGVYFPFWVTDADTFGSFDTIAKDVRTWTSGNVRYTETKEYRVIRKGDIHFEDLVTSALSEGDKKMLEGVLPFPTDAHVDFSMPYLSGFVAKKRNIEREAVESEVKGRMNGYARTILRRSVKGYSTVEAGTCDLRINRSSWNYTLMPVWILNYQNKKGRIYKYAMNGYTGKVYGEVPIHFGKLMILLGVVAAAVMPLAYAVISNLLA